MLTRPTFKRIGWLVTGSVLLLSVTSTDRPSTSNQTVYICTGPQSKRYHYDADCRGLTNCSKTVQAVSLSDARKMGRTLCGYED
ncbi:MAG: hypothetical protein KDC44_17200 [Phaeodactylibacter sp.]|nr:hypothetical protein [Phaeodactylibacter sp.]